MTEAQAKRDWIPLTLVETRTLTSGVRHLSFQSKDPIQFVPGQFINIDIPAEPKPIQRSYSIVSMPHEPTLDIACSYVKEGIASEYLFQMPVGSTLMASKPAGRLTLASQNSTHPKRYILVGTGTGITPYRSMLSTIQSIDEQKQSSFVCVMGFRRLEDMIYWPDFLKYASHIQGYVAFSQVHQNDCQTLQQVIQPWHVCTGYVQHQFHRLNLNPSEDAVYLCGNPNMVEESFLYLTSQMHFESKNIRREKYISPIKKRI